MQAVNIGGEVNQTLTITLATPPTLGAIPALNFLYNVPTSYTITAAGYPTPSIGFGSLVPPSGYTIHDNGNGTATLSGTNTLCSNSVTYTFSIQAKNDDGTASATVNLNPYCASSALFDIPPALVLTPGTPGSYTMTATPGTYAVTSYTFANSEASGGSGDGDLFSVLSSASLPLGSTVQVPTHTSFTCSPPAPLAAYLTCTDNGNGTLTMTANIPATATSLFGSTYSLSVTPHAEGSSSDVASGVPLLVGIPQLLTPAIGATSSSGGSTQVLTDVELPITSDIPQGQIITVGVSPVFLSPYSGATFSLQGALPSGVSFVSSGSQFYFGGEGPAAGTGGAYPVVVQGSLDGFTQSYPLTVYVFDIPSFTSASTFSFNQGYYGSFIVTTNGFPKLPIVSSNNAGINDSGMSITVSGNLPPGVTYSTYPPGSSGNTGALMISGTPNAAAGGYWPLTLTATNPIGTATQTLTLAVLPSVGNPVTGPSVPSISWNAPSAIAYGTALTATQLNATASVPGAFLYNPPSGTQLPTGTSQLSVTFFPNDTVHYVTTTATTSITVNQATPGILWPTPLPIRYGTPLQPGPPGVPVPGFPNGPLNAASAVAGTFVYSPPQGTILQAGTQPLSVTFTPNDTTDYTTASATNTITVDKATPLVGWPAPAAITFGSALGNGQLNATASVPGTFAYTPSAGTVLPVGANQTLSANFTPTDTIDYNTAPVSTTITVNPSASPGSPADIVVTKVLTRTGGNIDVTLTLANVGGTTAANVVVSSLKIGSTSGSPLPDDLGTIAAGTSVQTTITVPGSAGTSGSASSLTIGGSYTGGTFSSSARITLP